MVEASIDDYNDGMKACAEASKIWMQVSIRRMGSILRRSMRMFKKFVCFKLMGSRIEEEF